MTSHKIEKNLKIICFFGILPRKKHGGYKKIISSYVMPIFAKIMLFFLKFAIYKSIQT